MIPRSLRRDLVGLQIAHAWATLGTCGRRQVGCLLCDVVGKPVGEGYNGPAAGEPHCRDTGGQHDRRCPGFGAKSGTNLDSCEALHAEWNAIARCSDVRQIWTAYVTASPCMTCVKMLMGTGCVRIVFAEEYPHPEAKDRWINSICPLGPRQWIQIKDDLVTITTVAGIEYMKL